MATHDEISGDEILEWLSQHLQLTFQRFHLRRELCVGLSHAAHTEGMWTRQSLVKRVQGECLSHSSLPVSVGFPFQSAAWEKSSAQSEDDWEQCAVSGRPRQGHMCPVQPHSAASGARKWVIFRQEMV